MPTYVYLLIIVAPIVIIMFAIGCGFIAKGIARSKGRSGGWFWMGFWFDIVGIIIIACLPSVKGRQPDRFDELRKYKELLDEGVITREEYEAKKDELL